IKQTAQSKLAYFYAALMDQFCTALDKSRDQLESSGMGLAIVKKHIEVAGGEISVTSDGKRGTTFEFLWPVSVPQQDKAA
ncbi:ATP-binding protein, partial [Tritonibacter mobilis]|uniref:ATP-binding protein n=1 Tax=Tritonibacter mobilis TaxID=379347 RepID=UPI001F22D35D